jgi:hypothetical protein
MHHDGEMIVRQEGYLKYNDVLSLINKKTGFAIYKTHKGTAVLVEQPWFGYKKPQLFYPQDRYPYKLEEGKKIVICNEMIFNSTVNKIEDLDTKEWNNSEQIMSYTTNFETW